MATRSSQIIEDFKQGVTCPQCQQLYGAYNSRLLPCLHTFCVDCLHKLPVETLITTTPQAHDESKTLCSDPSPSQAEKINTDTKSRTTTVSVIESTTRKYIDCPKCQKQWQLPEKGVDVFQSPAIISDRVAILETLENLVQEGGPRCRHCRDPPLAVAYCKQHRCFICELCQRMHETWVEYRSHEVVSIEELVPVRESTSTSDDVEEATAQGGTHILKSLDVPKFVAQLQKLQGMNYRNSRDIPYCRLHLNTMIKFYCHNCRELVCHDCCLVGHRQHTVESVSKELLTTHEEDIRSIVASLDDTTKELDAMDRQNTVKKDAFTTHVSELQDELVAKFEELKKTIQDRQDELLTQLSELEKDPFEKLRCREQKIKKIHEKVAESRKFIENNLSNSGPTGVLSVERTVMENNRFLCSEFQTIPTIDESPQFQFIAYDKVPNLISSFGALRTVSSAGELPGKQKPPGSPRLLMSLTHRSLSSLTSSTSEVTSSTDDFQLLRQSQKYEEVFPIPLTVSVPRVQGDAVRAIQCAHHPSGITSANFLIICENGSNHCVSILTHQGILIRRIGGKGENDGMFMNPQCVAVDTSEQLFVTDSVYRFQVFDSNGTWLKTVGTRGKDKLQFKDAVGIAIGTNRRVFVCERENYRIQVLNSDLTHYKFIGQRGKGQCEFNQPADITIDAYGLLYIVDSFNHRIQVLTQEGSFVREFGSKGKLPGQLLSPSHLCVDPDGFVFVTELRNHRISMFTIRGEFVKCFGGPGSGLGQLSSPRGIAIDLNKILYVSDYGNDRIQVFK